VLIEPPRNNEYLPTNTIFFYRLFAREIIDPQPARLHLGFSFDNRWASTVAQINHIGGWTQVQRAALVGVQVHRIADCGSVGLVLDSPNAGCVRGRLHILAPPAAATSRIWLRGSGDGRQIGVSGHGGEQAGEILVLRKDVKGKPCFLFDATAVPQLAIDKVLSTAKDKKPATGVMRMEDRALTVVTKGSAPSSLLKAAQTAARDSKVKLKSVKVNAQVLIIEKELGEAYRGENKKAGWRTPEAEREEGESKEDFSLRQRATQKVRDGNSTTTKYFSAKERRNAEVRFDQGVATGRDGNALKSRKGFVIDPKTGKTYVFDDTSTKKGKKTLATHHSSPLAGGAVAGAGHLHADGEGHIVKLDDQSGHYKPSAEVTHSAVQHLEAQGALERPATDSGGDAGHRETRINLLDKNAGLTDAQWKKAKGDRGKIAQLAKINQMKGAFGEKMFAELKLERPEELKKLLASGKYRDVADLKSRLGEAEVKRVTAAAKQDPSIIENEAKALNLALKDVKLSRPTTRP